MKFAVTRPYDKPLENYGLKSMSFKKPNEFKEYDKDDDWYTKVYAEIEINTLEELLDFKQRCNEPIIIQNTDDFYEEYHTRYPYEIKIYDDWIE